MNTENLFKKTSYINNSFSRQIIKEPFTMNQDINKTIKYNSFGKSLEKDDIYKNNKNSTREGNKPYLITDYKKSMPNSFSPRNFQKRNRLKNIYLNENNSLILNNDLLNKKNKRTPILFKKNKIHKNQLKEIFESNLFKTNYKSRNQKLQIKAFNQISNDSQNNLKKNNENCNTNIIQSYNSYHYNTQRNRNLYSKTENNHKDNTNENHEEHIKKFELNIKNNKSYNFYELNKITFIDQHINKLLSKENNIKNNKIKITVSKVKIKNQVNLENNDKEIFSYTNKTFNDNYNNQKKIEMIKNQSYDDKFKNKKIMVFEKTNKIKNNLNHVNYINFNQQLDNLVHKIKFVNNYQEFENLVKTLTNEELYYLLTRTKMGKNILPILRKNKQKINLKLDFKQSYSFKEKPNISITTDLKKEDDETKILPINLYINKDKISFKNKLFPKIIKSNKNISNNKNSKSKFNNSILFHKNKENDKDKDKDKGKEPIIEIKKNSSLKQDLSFLGNSNTLNWNLISEEDKQRGVVFWKKFMKYIMTNKVDDFTNPIKSRNVDKYRNFTSMDIKSEKMEPTITRNKSTMLKSNQFLKENNKRKRKYFLDSNSYVKQKNYSFNKMEKKNNLKREIKPFIEKTNFEDKDKFPKNPILNIFDSKMGNRNYFKQANNNKFKFNHNLKNTFIKDNNIQKLKKKYIKDSIFKINNYTLNNKIKNNKRNKSLKLNKDNISQNIKDIINYIKSKSPNKMKSGSKRNSITESNLVNEFKQYLTKKKIIKNLEDVNIESLEEIKLYLLKYYKLSDANYHRLNLETNNENSNSEESQDENDDKKKEKNTKIIDLFGLHIKVRNTKDALNEYLAKRKLDEKELSKQIEFKNKLMKLITVLENERKERLEKKALINLMQKIKEQEKKEKEAKKVKIETEIKNNKQMSDSNTFRKKQLEKKIGDDPDGGNRPKFKKKKYLGKGNFLNIKEVEMKKLEVLYKIKNDLNFKIMKGYINVSDYDIYDKLKDRLSKLINKYNIQEYITNIEDCFDEFQEEIFLVEQRRRNEQRINAFIKDLNTQIDFNSIKKNVQEKKLCNVINYDSINRINVLNNIQENSL